MLNDATKGSRGSGEVWLQCFSKVDLYYRFFNRPHWNYAVYFMHLPLVCSTENIFKIGESDFSRLVLKAPQIKAVS